MKKYLSFLACSAMLLSLAACGNTPEESSSTPTTSETPVNPTLDLPDAPKDAFVSIDGQQGLQSKNYLLVFEKDAENQIALKVERVKDYSVIFLQEEMVNVKVRGKGTGIGIETYTERTYKTAYTSMEKTNYGYDLMGTIQTKQGSEFEVHDAYYLVNEDVFNIYRYVNVVKANEEDVGFASTVSLANADGIDDYSQFEYFIPSILYKDGQNVVSGAIASNLDLDRVYVKETRTGLPMVMARNKEKGYSLALTHVEPEISVGNNVGGGKSGDVNDELKYGAVGLSMLPEVSVDFVWPCTEGPNTYDAGQGQSRRYHEVKEGNSHDYKVGLIPLDEENYMDAMVESYKKAYLVSHPKIYDVNMEDIYQQNIDLFTSEYKEYKYNDKVVSAGFPWSIDLPNGVISQGYSFQMGFVGQQLPAGYQLYRYGLDHQNDTIKTQGKNIIDFWASSSVQSTYFPTVWWDPNVNASGGQRRNYPSFLRCMVDGMEGMLDAYRIASAYGENQQRWYDMVYKFGTNLVAKQNDDGSFYRAYKTNGNVETDTSNNTFQGTSKLNTPIAVRFLAKMYELTKEEKFKDAALKAAEFAYQNLYLGLGKYVGGTPDNPNTVDKEASVYALYCFDSAYLLSGDSKYLKAAEHAAISTMSWTYCYDFKVPSQNEEDSKKNPFENGGVIGFSVIATGHSGADNFSAYAFYEMYKIYLLLKDSFYKEAALLLQNDTKLSTDYDGRMGYAYKAMMPEATNVADFSFKSTNTWLPWSGVANMEPITNLYETFGKMNIEDVEGSLDSQLNLLLAYGNGGNPIKR